MDGMRVLVFSANLGSGHVRAAEALIEALRKSIPHCEIEHLDSGEFLGKLFNNIIRHTYIGLLKYSPKLWGMFYYGTAKIAPGSVVQRFLNRMGLKEFERLIRYMRPDVIICTYPTVAGVLSQLKMRRRLHVPFVTVVTDYVVHSQWIHSGVDLYIVGCGEVRDGLVSRGIDPWRIKATGIPVSSGFERSADRAAITSRLGLSPKHPTILIMGGAYGVLNSLRDLCRIFADCDFGLPVQTIVVCGKDRKLYESLDQVVADGKNPIVRFGFVNNVEELMSVADLMITKAGGLIVSEALTKRLPMVIYKPIPGQEEANTRYLQKIGAGRKADNLEELERTVLHLLRHPEELRQMSKGAESAVAGRSAENAVGHILELVYGIEERSKIG